MHASTNSQLFAMYTQRSGAGVTPTSTGAQAMHQVRYFHQDHLGSTSVITDEQGTVVERMAIKRKTLPVGVEQDKLAVPAYS